MTMPNLLPELISEILLRLSVKGLVRFSSVSKLWHRVIRSKDFIKEHHQHAINSNKDCILLRSRDDDRFDSFAFSAGTLNAEQQPIIKHPFYSVEERERLVLGSSVVAWCNGLILVEVVTRSHCLTEGNCYLFLWNPMIAKHRKIPYKASKLSPRLRQCYGLGYHYDEDDMKVLILTKRNGRNLPSELKIYSLASNTWKRVEKILPSNLALPYNRNYRNYMVSLNNSCVAWVMIDENDGTRLVVTFDLIKEEYHSFPMPNYPGHLTALGGYLFFWHIAQVFFTNVWIMNNDSNSWTLKLSVQVYCEPLFFDGERILLRKYGDQNLFGYSTKTQEYATTHHQYTRSVNTHTIFCVGNLRLLLDGDPDGMDTFGDR